MKYMLSFQCATHEEAKAVLAAVAAIGKEPMACSRQYVEPSQLSEKELSEIAAQGATGINTVPHQRKNISPGTSSITKIGSGAKETIIHALNTGTPLGDRYTEHLKLLWARGEIKFDGEVFYL